MVHPDIYIGLYISIFFRSSITIVIYFIFLSTSSANPSSLHILQVEKIKQKMFLSLREILYGAKL